jgi:hypothetical protein
LTGIGALRLVLLAGVSARTWREWQGQETRHNGHIPRDHWVRPEEAAAILEYCRDTDIAAVSPETLLRIIYLILFTPF